jgi:hypothetical protein
MGKASSSKKVARAARAGTTHKGPERRALGFPLAIGLVVLLGASLVFYSRENRSSAIEPQVGQHWHAAYGIWNCDHWEAPLTDLNGDPDGIHSHGDGVIHIHPFNSGAAGNRATLGKFFDTEGVKVDDGTKITLPSGTVLDASAGCNGEPATLEVARWPADKPDADPEIIKSSFDDIRLREDREVFTIALLKDGDTIQRPESVPTLDNLSDVPGTAASNSSTTVPSAPSDSSTTVPSAGDSSTTVPPDNAPTTTAG